MTHLVNHLSVYMILTVSCYFKALLLLLSVQKETANAQTKQRMKLMLLKKIAFQIPLIFSITL